MSNTTRTPAEILPMNKEDPILGRIKTIESNFGQGMSLPRRTTTVKQQQQQEEEVEWKSSLSVSTSRPYMECSEEETEAIQLQAIQTLNRLFAKFNILASLGGGGGGDSPSTDAGVNERDSKEYLKRLKNILYDGGELGYEVPTPTTAPASSTTPSNTLDGIKRPWWSILKIPFPKKPSASLLTNLPSFSPSSTSPLPIPSKSPFPLSSVFSVSLVHSITYAGIPVSDAEPSRLIPIIVFEILQRLRTHGLQSNGLFRVNGSEKRMAQMIAEFNLTTSNYGRNFDFSGYNVYDAADVLKKYLRSMPEPLMSWELYPFYLRCLQLPVDNQVYALRLLILLLPPCHIILLETLVEFFAQVSANSAENLMTAQNLAKIIAPNIFRGASSMDQPSLEDYDKCTAVFEIILQHPDQFTRITRSVGFG